MSKMINIILLIVSLSAGFLFFDWTNGDTACAGEAQILVNKLVEKGILTPEEAQALLKEMQSEAMRTKSTVKQVASETAKEVTQKEAKKAAPEVPKWIEKVAFKGDFRLRYQRERKENSSPGRSRVRVRFRMGAKAKVNNKWETGFGFASGGTDPRSTNETLDKTFETPDLRLDYAYVKFAPVKEIVALGGKFKNPIWKPKDLMWDGDIRTDGIAVPIKFKVNGTKLFVTPAWFVLDEYKADRKDPYVGMIQAGVDAKLPAGFYIKGAGAYYAFEELKGNSFTHSAGTNSTDAAGGLMYDYKCWNVDGEVGMKIKNSPVGKWAVFGQYVENTDPDDDNQGYLFGAKIGSGSVKKLGDWEVKYNYRKLETDAWPDFLPDSDFYGGETNAKGHEFEFKLGLAKNTTFGIDYYWDVKPINGPNTDKKQYVFQADLLLKW